MRIAFRPLLLCCLLASLPGCTSQVSRPPSGLPAPSTVFSYEIVEWNHTMPRKKKLITKEEGFCCLSGVFGSYNGGGEFAKVYLDPADNCWYVEGQNGAGFGGCQVLIVRITHP